MMFKHWLGKPGLLMLVLMLVGVSLAAPVQSAAPGLGILGDSNTDEYRADDNRGGAYAATTLNWAELLQRYRGTDWGVWGTRSEPRRTGYAYNWARSGATACSMSNSQTSGLAAQVSAGQVSDVVIFVGSNDFHSWNGTYDEIYTGALSDAGVQSKVNSILNCITTSVAALQNAGAQHVILANYADPGSTRDFQTRYPSASGRQRVSNAIMAVNSGLDSLIVARGLIKVDWANFGTSLLGRIDASGNIIVGGIAIDTATHNDEPHHLQLGDSIGHIGTVVNGIIANLFIDALNRAGRGIARFSEGDMLVNAGIGAAPSTVTPRPSVTPTPSLVVTLTPVPTLTPTPTAAPLPTVAGHQVRIVSRVVGNRMYTTFDGITENGVLTEVTSPRFVYSSGWTTYASAGRAASPARAAFSSGRTITFTTNAAALVVQTYRSPVVGAFDVYVDNRLVTSYDGYSGTSGYVDFVVTLS